MLEQTLQWVDLVKEIAGPAGIQPAVVLAIIWMESRGNADEFNHISQATGLMQVIPCEAGVRFADRPTIEQLQDPRTNVTWGVRILADYLKRKDGLWEALYYYSGGPAWSSPQHFTRAYWERFRSVKIHVERKLREKETSDGRLPIRDRHLRRQPPKS